MKRFFIIAVPVLVLFACSKEQVNPYDQLVHASPNPPAESLPQDNFAWLHQRVFRPTCANSGCHDGHFEPDYRTIASAYNSLVYAPVINNDPQESFTYRVLPGNPALSFLHERLTVFVPNTSGVMPLETIGTDWSDNQGAYIAAITQWIQGGAKDMFGALPSLGNREPQVTGMLAFAPWSTTNPFPRGTDPGVQPIEVTGNSIDLWFAFADDSTAAESLSYNKVKVSTVLGGFALVPEQMLAVGSTLNGPDFGNNTTTFTHKATLDLSTYAPGTMLFVRSYVNDGDHIDNTEVPNDGTTSPMLGYFTLLVNP
ncbi:MAG: hypothetical protein ABI599_02055 [Flavobacteriales bacterium]